MWKPKKRVYNSLSGLNITLEYIYPCLIKVNYIHFQDTLDFNIGEYRAASDEYYSCINQGMIYVNEQKSDFSNHYFSFAVPLLSYLYYGKSIL